MWSRAQVNMIFKTVLFLFAEPMYVRVCVCVCARVRVRIIHHLYLYTVYEHGPRLCV